MALDEIRSNKILEKEVPLDDVPQNLILNNKNNIFRTINTLFRAPITLVFQ
jgi:hypothetical protein